MKARWIMTLLALVAIAIMAAGCGGNDDDSASGSQSGSGSAGGGTASVSVEEFVDQGNEACKEAQKKAFAKVGLYSRLHRDDGLSQEELRKRSFNWAILSTVEDEIEALRELPPAEGEEQSVEALLASKEAALRKAKKIEEKAELPAVVAFFDGANDKAQSLGISGCVVTG
jgi:hypothetical protein